MKHVINFFKNKFYISLIAFLVWMFLFDRNDLVSQYQHRSKLKELEAERAYFKAGIKEIEKDIEELTTDQSHLEKFAREKYLMKKDNEDVYVIVKE